MTTTSRVRDIVVQQGRLPPAVGADDDLSDAGLDSIGMVHVMLALEESFGVVFPDAHLRRESFASISSLTRIIEDLKAASP